MTTTPMSPILAVPIPGSDGPVSSGANADRLAAMGADAETVESAELGTQPEDAQLDEDEAANKAIIAGG